MQTTKNQNMAGTKVQTSKVWKRLIFPELARFSGETGSREDLYPLAEGVKDAASDASDDDV
jgi:hypothetical protein